MSTSFLFSSYRHSYTDCNRAEVVVRTLVVRTLAVRMRMRMRVSMKKKELQVLRMRRWMRMTLRMRRGGARGSQRGPVGV